MNGILYVALGGAVGASLRYVLGLAATRSLGPDYPYGTLADCSAALPPLAPFRWRRFRCWRQKIIAALRAMLAALLCSLLGL